MYASERFFKTLNNSDVIWYICIPPLFKKKKKIKKTKKEKQQKHFSNKKKKTLVTFLLLPLTQIPSEMKSTFYRNNWLLQEQRFLIRSETL